MKSVKKPNKTEEFIREHQHRVQLRGYKIIECLRKRLIVHDESKLEEPEFSMWCEMDKEPHYKYDDPRYHEKKERYHYVFEQHYADNRNKHHPEHWCGYYQDMDLLDLLEMLCDWTSFDKFTDAEAIVYVEKQCDRFGFDVITRNLILNTFRNYFTVLEADKKVDELINPENFDLDRLSDL